MIAKVRNFFQSAMKKVEKLRAMVLFSFKMQSCDINKETKRRLEMDNALQGENKRRVRRCPFPRAAFLTYPFFILSCGRSGVCFNS